jgi:hypothetical protein
MDQIKKKKVAIVFLMLGMFFNPFGYDAIFKMILDFTGSYWNTVGIFYLIAGSFFGLYFYFSEINLFVVITNFIFSIINKIKDMI